MTKVEKKEYDKAYQASHRVEIAEQKKEYGKRYRNTHRSEINARQRRYYYEHREEKKAYSQEHYRGRFEYYLKWRYGLTPEDYAYMLENQNHCCAVCGVCVDMLGKDLVVDHDHKTGQIRGLLCNPCNQAIGLLKEDKGLFLNVLSYLEVAGG